jgi:hypothetical protein
MSLGEINFLASAIQLENKEEGRREPSRKDFLQKFLKFSLYGFSQPKNNGFTIAEVIYDRVDYLPHIFSPPKTQFTTIHKSSFVESSRNICKMSKIYELSNFFFLPMFINILKSRAHKTDFSRVSVVAE